MDTFAAVSYRGCRFPGEIISHCVWLYFRFCLSFRDVQEMLFERGVAVSHEAIRLWTLKFGAEYAHRLRRCAGCHGDTWHLDEVFCKINGELVYLWRAVPTASTNARRVPTDKQFATRSVRRIGRKASISSDFRHQRGSRRIEVFHCKRTIKGSCRPEAAGGDFSVERPVYSGHRPLHDFKVMLEVE